MLKTIRILAITALAALLATGTGLADEVKPGDSRETVIKNLGEPAGVVSFGNQEVLHYPRGQVELIDGKVVGSSIISESEFRRREQARQAQEEEARRAAEEAAAAAPPPVTEPEEDEAAPTPEQLEAQARRQAEIEAKIAEGMRDPPSDMSSRRLRRFRRGRSESLLLQREEQLRRQFEEEEE